MMFFKSPKQSKIVAFFLIVLLSLCIIITEIFAATANAFWTATPEQNNIGISATVDDYLAVYKKPDGDVSAETNTGNEYFADGNICVISY